MIEKFTDVQLRILRGLRECRKRRTGVYSAFVDEIYKNIPVEVNKSRFREDLDILRGDGYIERKDMTFGDDFGNYAITPDGLKVLREIDG